MEQGALQRKDESGKVGAPRGHPGERNPQRQEEEGCIEEKVQDVGVALVSGVSCFVCWEERPRGLAAVSVW